MLQLPLPEGSSSCSNALVQQQMVESVYFSQKWHDLIIKLYGYTFIPLEVKNGLGQVAGFLPLCHVSSAITGPHLVSFPFSDHCPLLAENDEIAHALLDQAAELAEKTKVRYLELRTGQNALFSHRSDFVEGNLYSSWKTPLVSDSDIIWSHLEKATRNRVKKARKSGVEIRFAENRDDILKYYRLHLQTRSKKHGMPSQPRRYFLELWETFAASGYLRVILAEYKRTVVAGSILMCSGQTARFLYGASDADHLFLAPNNLLTWETIVWCCSQGYKTLVHGRTARVNAGLMKFNRQWAAVEEPLPYYYYPNKAGLAATSEDSWRYNMLTSCWRCIPLSLSGPLGGFVYRHLG